MSLSKIVMSVALISMFSFSFLGYLTLSSQWLTAHQGQTIQVISGKTLDAWSWTVDFRDLRMRPGDCVNVILSNSTGAGMVVQCNDTGGLTYMRFYTFFSGNADQPQIIDELWIVQASQIPAYLKCSYYGQSPFPQPFYGYDAAGNAIFFESSWFQAFYMSNVAVHVQSLSHSDMGSISTSLQPLSQKSW